MILVQHVSPMSFPDKHITFRKFIPQASCSPNHVRCIAVLCKLGHKVLKISLMTIGETLPLI